MIGWGMVGGLQGPTGADGDAGADGPEGPEGPAGPAGDFSAVPTGSVAEPGLGFDGEATTGLSRPSAGVFAFSVVGVERARLVGSDASLVIPGTGAGRELLVYNTADEATNYSRTRVGYATGFSDYFAIATEQGGSGVAPGLLFTAPGGTVILSAGSGGYPPYSVLRADGSIELQSGTTLRMNRAGRYRYYHDDNAVKLSAGESVERVHLDPTGIGFNGATPIAKPTVTDLPTLITALEDYGLVIDGS